jgi:hypothetical protein
MVLFRFSFFWNRRIKVFFFFLSFLLNYHELFSLDTLCIEAISLDLRRLKMSINFKDMSKSGGELLGSLFLSFSLLVVLPKTRRGHNYQNRTVVLCGISSMFT